MADALHTPGVTSAAEARFDDAGLIAVQRQFETPLPDGVPAAFPGKPAGPRDRPRGQPRHPSAFHVKPPVDRTRGQWMPQG